MGVDKASLRADMRHALSEIPPLERNLQEELVNAAIQGTQEWQHATTVVLYGDLKDEFSVTALGNAAFRVGKRVAFPKVADMTEGRLHFHAVSSWEGLVPGGFGISEPRGDLPVVYPDEADLAIVPGLAWTDAGARLGQGGGFYDRVMERFKGPAWGVGFDCQLLDDLPEEAHDRRVDRVWVRSLLHD